MTTIGTNLSVPSRRMSVSSCQKPTFSARPRGVTSHLEIEHIADCQVSVRQRWKAVIIDFITSVHFCPRKAAQNLPCRKEVIVGDVTEFGRSSEK